MLALTGAELGLLAYRRRVALRKTLGSIRTRVFSSSV
jgi:hypothetical protein